MKAAQSVRVIGSRPALEFSAGSASGLARRRASGASAGVSFEHLLGRGVQARQSGGALAASSLAASSSAGRADSSAYRPMIESTARRYGLDPALLLGVVEAESGFNPSAVSRAGAKGLMQLMDGTARSYGVADPYSPQQNVDGGARFLRDLLNRYKGSVPLALAAYNAGPAAVDRYGGVPPFDETRAYVSRVQATAKQYGADVGTS